MEFSKVSLYVFSGSGNTWLLANRMTNVFLANGTPCSLYRMPGQFCLPEKNSLLGFVFPTAYFSTYPFLLDFFARLPDGAGQPVFILTSMAGATGGMPQAISRFLTEKGYAPTGSAAIKMPSNYGKNQSAATLNNETVIENALVTAENFAGQLLAGKSVSPGGSSRFAAVMQNIAAKRWSVRIFRRFFPLRIEKTRCLKCGFCQSICPAGAIETLPDGFRHITERCQSCQHCSAFCPSSAIRLPGQTGDSYKAADYTTIKQSFSNQAAAQKS